MAHRALPMALLAAALTSACWLGDCGGADTCDPTKEDCSLSVTCCTPVVPSAAPPAALSLACLNEGDSGDDFAEFRLNWNGGTPPYTYSATFGDGQTETRTLAATPGLPTSVRVTHTYTRPESLDGHAFMFSATVTDQAGQSQSCSVGHNVDPARLDLDCVVDPRVGTVPLYVTFDATPHGCLGSCTVSWDFGDGEGSPTRHATHTYMRPGDNAFLTHPARGTVVDVVDGVERTDYCPRPVLVNPSEPPANPTPGPPSTPSNRPPVISGLAASPSTIFPGEGLAVITATLSDPDGDAVTWTVTLDPASTITGLITVGSGSGHVASGFRSSSVGTAVIRVTASDGRGGTATATVTVSVVGL